MSKIKKIAFLGLGVMGSPMAGHLSKRFPVVVFNRTKSKATEWVNKYNGKMADSPKEAAEGADIVFSCVGNDDHLREVTIGEQGAFQAMNPGSIYVDHSTTSAKVAKELYHIASNQNILFLDCPISGGQEAAETGQLSFMVGGDKDVFESIEEVLSINSKKCVYIGQSGSGQLTKMVNQVCIAGIVQGLSEALLLGQKSGLDMGKVVDVISQGAAGSWQMNNRAKTMLDEKFDFGFAVDWMRKDLGFCLDQADEVGIKLPITEIVDQFYAEIQNKYSGRLDTSSLIKRLAA